MHLGIDTVEIDRIEESIKNNRFVERVYSAEEIEELSRRNFIAQSAAACFAAKEAFSKSIGTGIRGFSLNEVSLLHDELGAPFLKFSGKAADICKEKGYEYSVSITHTDKYATAVVVAY